jgi:hypothetical protein
MALDHARLGSTAVWALRILAPGAAILVSAGFFGVAHVAALKWILYAGAACLTMVTLLTGIGLLR